MYQKFIVVVLPISYLAANTLWAAINTYFNSCVYQEVNSVIVTEYNINYTFKYSSI